MIMIVKRIKTFTDSNKKEEAIIGGAGLLGTGAKILHDYKKDGGVSDTKRLISRDLRNLKEAKNLVNEVEELKNPELFHPDRFRLNSGNKNQMWNRNYSPGQIEATENALNTYDMAKAQGYKKIAKKQLKSAEKHANMAVNLAKKELAESVAKKNSAYKKLGRNAAIGLALTGGAVAGVHALKKRKNKKEK